MLFKQFCLRYRHEHSIILLQNDKSQVMYDDNIEFHSTKKKPKYVCLLRFLFDRLQKYSANESNLMQMINISISHQGNVERNIPLS